MVALFVEVRSVVGLGAGGEPGFLVGHLRLFFIYLFFVADPYVV